MGYDIESGSYSMEHNSKDFDKVSVSENTNVNMRPMEVTENHFDDCRVINKIENNNKYYQPEVDHNEYDDCKKEVNPKLSDIEPENEEFLKIKDMFEDCYISDKHKNPLNQEDIQEKTNLKEYETGKEVASFDTKDIEQYKREYEVLENQVSEKFEAVMKEERGTDAYKAALKEYNDIREMKDEAQIELEERTLQLRTAQIEKGQIAFEDSELTLNISAQLQDKFEEEFYRESPDENELKIIWAENDKQISKLTSEKAAIQTSMRAKMSEMRDYVIENRYTPYETNNDPYYQQLSAEYLELSDAYNKLNYHVVKLDDNNIQISECIGERYESIIYREKNVIKEVAEGTDIPGETDYFKNEVRAEEVLSIFQQDFWEKMSLDEKMEGLQQIADYNQEILDIDNPPEIIYYNKEDSREFGAFSDSQNAIYINIYNISDAKEAADTISHEYRHCYQHQRAEKLEVERDLEFKEGFDNYISSENDYEGYKNQFVETDARDYAKVFKDKIDNLQTTDFYQNMDSLKNLEGKEEIFKQLNLIKGTVFEKIDFADLPDDFRKTKNE